MYVYSGTRPNVARIKSQSSRPTVPAQPILTKDPFRSAITEKYEKHQIQFLFRSIHRIASHPISSLPLHHIIDPAGAEKLCSVIGATTTTVDELPLAMVLSLQFLPTPEEKG
jgi:hypothetical protein